MAADAQNKMPLRMSEHYSTNMAASYVTAVWTALSGKIQIN